MFNPNNPNRGASATFHCFGAKLKFLLSLNSFSLTTVWGGEGQGIVGLEQLWDEQNGVF